MWGVDVVRGVRGAGCGVQGAGCGVRGVGSGDWEVWPFALLLALTCPLSHPSLVLSIITHELVVSHVAPDLWLNV